MEPRKWPEQLLMLAELPIGPADKIDRLTLSELATLLNTITPNHPTTGR